MQRPGLGKSSATSAPREDGGRRDRREGPATLVRMWEGLRNFFFWVIRGEAGGRRGSKQRGKCSGNTFQKATLVEAGVCTGQESHIGRATRWPWDFGKITSPF